MLNSSMLRAFPVAVMTGVSLGVLFTPRGVRAEAPAPALAEPSDTAPAAPATSPAPEGASAATETATPAPSREALAEARRHFDVALECYSRGRYRDAIAELEQARRLDPAGKDLVYNLALVHEKLGELSRALAYLRRYLEMETDAEERARTEASIVRLEGALGEGYGAAPRPAPSALVLPTPAAPTPPPGRLDGWVWSTGAVAVCSLIVGAVLGVRALALSPGPDDATGGSRAVDDVRNDAHAAHRSAVAADVAFGVAAVSGAAATLLYFGRAPQAESDVADLDAATATPIETASPKLGLDLNFAF